MRKKLALLLSVLMIFGMFTVTSNAAVSPNHQMTLAGTSGELYSGVNGIVFDMQIKAPKVGSTASVIIKFDSTKLEFVTPASNTPNAVPITSTTGLLTLAHPAGWGDLHKEKAGWVNSVAFIGGVSADGNTTYLGIQPEFATANLTTHASALTSATKFCLAFKQKTDGSGQYYSAADIDANTIKVLTADEIAAVNQSEAAVITDGAGDEYNCNPTVASGKENNLKTPDITLNGSPLATPTTPATPLTSITVSLNDATLAVPTKGNTATTTATATPNTGADLGTVAWSIDPAYDGVSIDASTGAITVQPSAAATTASSKVTVKATSGSVSGTAELELTKDAATPTIVTVNPTSATVTLNADGSAPDAIDAAVTVEDQYGATMTGQTITASGINGVSWANDKLTFTTDLRATTGAQNVTLTCGTETATFALTVNKAAAPAAPTAPTGVDPSGKNQTDGKITGVDSTMEYSSNGGTSWTAVTGNEVTGLGKGAYKVRLKATDFAEASAAKDISLTEPGVSATPVVTITGAPKDGKAYETDKVTLTASVTGHNGGTLTYQWAKDGTDLTGKEEKDLVIDSFTAADAGEYTVKVTNKEEGKEISDPVTSAGVTLAVKEKAAVEVAPKASVKKSLSSWKIADLVTVTIPDDAEEVEKGDIVASKKATMAADGTWSDEKGVVTAVFYKAEEADGATTYTKITDAKNLVAGTYYVDYAVKAVTDQKTYKVDAKALAGSTPTDGTLTNYIKVELTKSSAGSVGGGSDGGSSSDLSRYLVTYDAGDHGKIFSGSSTERVVEGDKPANVPTIKADDGYKFIGWTLNGKSVKPASTVIDSSTKFVAEYTTTKDLNAYIEGISDDTFAPNANATRGEIATMMARLYKDYDENAGYTSDAPDVAEGAWYANAVNYAIKQGVMNGYKEDGTFRPTNNITRGEFAAMLARYLGINEVSDNRFSDMSGKWSAGYVNALAAAGIVDGFEDGAFKADELLTRAQAVKMIDLAINMSYDSSADYEKIFNDVPRDAWYYVYVMPAANLDIAPYQK